MKITDVKMFIEEFIESEHQFSHAEYNTEISDEECAKLAENANAFFYYTHYKRVSGIVQNKGKLEWEDRYKLRLNKTIPRTLFQIKQYKNPKLGDVLKRIAIGNDLFACYVSYPSKGGRDLYFSSIFYVAETNEGWKFIYEKSFNSDTGIWYHPVDMSHVTVIDEGQLMKTQKYIAPLEATSLADYNKD